MKHVGKVIDMGYHRNGITGDGFWTIIFEGAPGSDSFGKIFVATHFPKYENEIDDCPKRTSILVVKDLANWNANGTMRGDQFHDEIVELVENYEWPHEKRARENITNRRAAIEHTRAKVLERLTEERSRRQ